MEKISICIIGSGKCATAIAKIVAENAIKLDDVDDRVNMYVYEEIYEDTKLSTLININHVNKKYAPEIMLPGNLVAVTDLEETARYADIIIFIMPHFLMPDFCRTLLGKIKSNAVAITLTNSFIQAEDGGFQLSSHTVMKYLKIPCAVLVGANLATTLNFDSYCEATLGCRDLKSSVLFENIFNTPNFRVTVVEDADCVEVLGYLKHIMSFSAGLLDGFECNVNSKLSCLRLGVLEMIRFIDVFYPSSKLSTIFKSCGFADVVTVCSGSRGRRLAEAFVKRERPLEELELEMFGGQKVLGRVVVNSVSLMLKQKGLEDKFPLFTTINNICHYTANPEEILKCLIEISGIIYHPTKTYPL